MATVQEIEQQIKDRLEELGPVVEEYEELERAAEALDKLGPSKRRQAPVKVRIVQKLMEEGSFTAEDLATLLGESVGRISPAIAELIEEGKVVDKPGGFEASATSD